jgi:hypothetical protein
MQIVALTALLLFGVILNRYWTSKRRQKVSAHLFEIMIH